MRQLKLPFEKEDSEKINHDSLQPHQTVKQPKPKPARRYRNKEEYYQSKRWREIRAFALIRAKNRCQKCGREDQLEVRHLTYDRLYNELPNDLEVLCDKCHHEQSDERGKGH